VVRKNVGSLGVIPDKGHPALRGDSISTTRAIRHVSSDRTRRHTDCEFQQEFCGDALFAPSRVAFGQFHNKAPKFCWQGVCT